MTTELMQTDQNSLNPFQVNAEIVASPSAMVEIASDRAVAEIKGMITAAKVAPRNQIQAMERILTACQRKGLAEIATYCYARGGSSVSGPSIRLAETIAQNWGNIKFGWQELEQSQGYSSVETFAWDLETNTLQTRSFKVKHERRTKTATKLLDDPRDVYETVANYAARRLRACILGIIPKDVIDSAVKQCQKTLRASVPTDAPAIKRMLDMFSTFKVTKAQIEKRIQRKIESIETAQMLHLKEIYNSLSDNMSVASDWFEFEAPPIAGDSITEQLKEKLSAKEPAV